MNSKLIRGGHGCRWRRQGWFAQPQRGDTGPRMGKFTNLNVGGWESTTLEEVKEAVLPTTPASPEHLQLNYEIMNARFTRLEMDIWQPLYDW